MNSKEQQKTEYARMMSQASHAEQAYWSGAVTRQELHTLLAEQAEVLNVVTATLRQLDAVVGYLIEKFEVAPEDIRAFLAKSSTPTPKLILGE